MRQNFTAFGATQFLRDVNGILGLLERYLPAGAGPLSPLSDGLVLLNLPIRSDDGIMVLAEASKRVFQDNAEAKAVLEELGIDGLTPANARNILQRRVENSE